MSKNLHRTGIAFLLSALAVPAILLSLPVDRLPTLEAFAPCHQEVPVSGMPGMPNHDCCLVGHNHVLPGHIVSVQPVLSLVALEAVLAQPSPLLLRRPEPALSSFDPPLTDLSLRI
jgi:hypothetical protein